MSTGERRPLPYLQRAAWARGERGLPSRPGEPVEISGPDGVPVRIRVRWLGSREVTSIDPPTSSGLSDLGSGDLGALLALLGGLILLIDLTVRWLVVEIPRRPRWAVTAEVPPARVATVVVRSRRASDAARAAAELADRVERQGVAAVRETGS